MSEHITREDADLDYTNQIRKRLVESLTEEGKMPKETREMSVLLAALDGIDRAAMGMKRIAADQEIAGKQSHASALIAELFRDGRTLKIGVALGERTAPPELGDDILPGVILDGELTTNPGVDNYDAFCSRTSLGMSQ